MKRLCALHRHRCLKCQKSFTYFYFSTLAKFKRTLPSEINFFTWTTFLIVLLNNPSNWDDGSSNSFWKDKVTNITTTIFCEIYAIKYISFDDERLPQGPLWSCVVVQVREESPVGKKTAYTISYRTKPCVHTNLEFSTLKMYSVVNDLWSRILWFYQLSWKCKLVIVQSLKANVSTVSPSSERIGKFWVACGLYKGRWSNAINELMVPSMPALKFFTETTLYYQYSS